MTVTFVVPGVPAGKMRPRFARMGKFVRTYQPAEDARRENLIALAYRQAAGEAPPHDGPISLSIVAFFTPPASWSGKRRVMAMDGLV
ncbi:MAG: RusA family crossover junction endodeoxyribonuclease, partial [Planctomycetota bacterium]|nr:RusA family crossover junction endodeoxyribonuclease [Planctomycetota bacterium]